IQISLSNGLTSTLPSFVATDDAVQRVLSVLFVPLAVIGAVGVLLAARLVAERRRGEFTMMRARGASLRQLVTTALAGGAAVVLPAAAAGVGAAVLATPGPASSLAWWLAGLIIAPALVCPAAGGLILLRQQGLPPPGQVDLFTSAAPVLAAVPVALLIMRAY